MPGTEIINCNFDPNLMQARQHTQGVVGVKHHRSFGNFYFQSLRGHFMFAEQGLNIAHQVGFVKIGRRDIDRHVQFTPLVHHLTQGIQGVIKHPGG